MIGEKRDVAELLGEEESRSIMERLRRKAHEKELKTFGTRKVRQNMI